jgi:hypothetical protein
LAGTETSGDGGAMKNILLTVLIKNLHIIGNCLGTTEDLRDAIRDFALDSFRVVIDTVFTGDRVGPFLDRTYNSRERFGKVVYRYN